jgi:leucyl aminopeptidase
MSLMKFEFSLNNLESVSADAVLVFCFAGSSKQEYIPLESFLDMDEVMQGQLNKVCELENFRGEKDELLSVIPAVEMLGKRVLVVGLGKKETFVTDHLRTALAKVSVVYRNKVDSLVLKMPEDLGVESDLSVVTQAIAEGLLLGGYEFVKYKKPAERGHVFSSVLISEKRLMQQKVIKDAVMRAELFAKATFLARDLVNGPASEITPAYLADMAQQISKANPQVSCKVFSREELEQMGMGAFLSIAKAAGETTEPKFIHLEYKPKKAATKRKLALIGKGITFDTGGISLKPAEAMKSMKCDMSGAAAVLGVFSVISELDLDYPVLGLIAATPNLVSGTSTVPGDVARALNGKTIEILNTDAEGRVTMADSLSYAVKHEATDIIDLATLTGACMVALGPSVAGLFSNNQDLTDLVKRSAYEAGEKVWELPLESEYKALNKSDVADIANIAATRYGGAITAALFLEEFVSNTPWVHLDIAGPAFAEKPTGTSSKGGTGFGVRTILNLLPYLR